MIDARTDEDHHQLALLGAPTGLPGSGRVRYGAAMYFNRTGRLSDAALEVYRTCSPCDGEDPSALLRERGLGAEVPGPAPAARPAALLALVEAAASYLAGLEGPGLGEVRAGLARGRRNLRPSGKEGATHAVVARWLHPAIESLAADRPDLARAIGAAAPFLDWGAFDGYPRDLIGADFADGHAFASLVGEVAPFAARDWEFGLFLIAPHVLYRDHRHVAPELYAPLTGPHGWRFGPDRPLLIRPAHRPVWNDPLVPHLTKVGPVPFLCFYCWTRDVNAGAEVVAAADWPALEALRLPG